MPDLIIKTPKEFSYGLALGFLTRSPQELLHTVDGHAVTKLLSHNDEKILFELLPIESGLSVRFLNGNPSSGGKELVKNYVEEWFDLKTDLRPFYKLVSTDKLVGPLVKLFYGYRIMGQPDLFESIVFAILGQQINLQFAYALKHRFVEKFGERLFFNNESYFLFPTPKVVAGLTDDVLLPLQFSRQKSKYTIGVAEMFASGELSKEKLTGLSLPEAKEKLMQIKGIGNWTANYALMRTFKHPDAFPLEDAGLHNAIKNLKKMKSKPTLEQVKRIFKKYKGWEAYATLYLWKSL